MKQISTTKEKEMNSLIAILAFLTVLMSFISLTVSYVELDDLKQKVTGRAIGYVNVTLQTVVSVNISPRDINWGPGYVNSSGGWRNATLVTGTGSDGNVSCGACGNWTSTGSEGQSTKGLNITNDGNVNASITIASQLKSAHALFGGTPAYEAYMWKATDSSTNALTGCVGNINGTWQNITSVTANVCDNLGYADTRDEIYVDLYLRVPYDANVSSQRDTRTDVLTISISAKP